MSEYFEYKVIQFEGTGSLEKELNSLGRDGWRLAHTTTRGGIVYFVFERVKMSSKSLVTPRSGE